MKEFSKEIHLGQLQFALQKILLAGYADMFLRHGKFNTIVPDGKANYSITILADAKADDTDNLRFLTIQLAHTSGWSEIVKLDFPQESNNVFVLSIQQDSFKPYPVNYARISRVLTHLVIKIYEDFTVDGEPRNTEIQYYSSSILTQILTDRGNVSRKGTRR
jgi:hypothetical protein